MFIAIAAAALAFSGEPYLIGVDHRACAAQPDLAWCAGRAEEGKPVTVFALRRYQARVFGSVIYTPTDRPENEVWHSFAAETARGEKWRGDCDNVVFTMLDMMERDGYDVRETYRMGVAINGAGAVNHLVAVARIGSELYVFGDATRREVYPLREATWRPIMAAPSTSEAWRDVVAAR